MVISEVTFFCETLDKGYNSKGEGHYKGAILSCQFMVFSGTETLQQGGQ